MTENLTHTHSITPGNINESGDGFSLLSCAEPMEAQNRAARMTNQHIDDISVRFFEVFDYGIQIDDIRAQTTVPPYSGGFMISSIYFKTITRTAV
jgi:hypothetical protein